MEVFARQRLLLNRSTRRVVLAPIAVPALTSRVRLLIARPTTLNPLAWGDADTFQVSAYLDVDGVEEHVFRGRATGGIRLDLKDAEIALYRLAFTPSYGFFGRRDGFPVRLGERALNRYQLRVEIDALSGNADSTIAVELDEAEAPRLAFRSSVAFDTSTSAQELAGDGVLSLSHTASGDNRAAIAGVIGVDNPWTPSSTSATYNGVAMTERWDVALGAFRVNAAYTLAAPDTGSQTVTSTIGTATPIEHAMGVISVTGTSEVGTANTATGGAVSPATVTVAGTVTGGLVVDVLLSSTTGATTAGADQTERESESTGNALLKMSTQPGASGGVMSWDITGPFSWAIGGIEFKPALGKFSHGFRVPRAPWMPRASMNR